MKTEQKRFSRKLLSLFLTAVLMLGMIRSFSTKVFAAGDNWADEVNRDTTWMDGAISTPQQLAQFAYLINSGAYTGENNVWLEDDIDLGGKEWTPIGIEDDDDKIYDGLFNGNGFTVSNMSITDFTKANNAVGLYGFFGLLGGTVRNVHVTGAIECSYTSNYYFIGGIAGYSYYGKLINCISDVTITVTSDTLSASDIGGIVGANYGEISGCVNNGDIYLKKGNSSPVGGIAGLNVGIIDRCENHGKIEGYTTYIGGIVGYSYKDTTYYDNPSLTNCYNTGDIADIDGNPNLYYGGIVGYSSNVLVENCYNVSTVAENVIWGNLVGQLRGDGILINCYFLENGRFGLGMIGSTLVTDSTVDQGIQMTNNEMKSEGFIATLNGTDNAFVFNSGGYPVLAPLPMTVTISATPDIALVVVSQNDTKISAEIDGSYLLSPGEYSVTVTADNYNPKTENFTVTLNQNTHTINITLDILPADYSIVDAAKAKIPFDLSFYTDDSVESLNVAVSAVVGGLDITKQDDVDSYAKAIENAVNGLVYKGADYSLVDAAKAKIPSDLSVYTDDSVVVLNIAVSAVVDGLDITKQDDVDGYAKAIENAVNNLVLKTVTPSISSMGDSNNMWLYITISLLALGGIALTLLVKRKKK